MSETVHVNGARYIREDLVQETHRELEEMRIRNGELITELIESHQDGRKTAFEMLQALQQIERNTARPQ